MKTSTAKLALEALKGMLAVMTDEELEQYPLCVSRARGSILVLQKEISEPPEQCYTGMSSEADFATDTWSFKMDPGYVVGSGQYKITRIKGNAA